MAIDKSRRDVPKTIGDKSEVRFSNGVVGADVEDAPRLEQSRSSEGPICEKCPNKRSDAFLREHTFLRRNSAMTTCPNCLRGVETIVERQNTYKTHLSALLLLPVCMCVLPYCSRMLRNAVHHCPECGVHLGARFASMTEAFVVCFSSGEHESDELPESGDSVHEDSYF